LRSAMLFLARYMLSPVRLSVRLSVTRVDHTKTTDIMIMNFSPYGSFMLHPSSF